MQTKPMTRAQMRQAAFLARESDLEMAPRGLIEWCIEQPQQCVCPSMLLSEAHRPAGHDGDGTDEL